MNESEVKKAMKIVLDYGVIKSIGCGSCDKPLIEAFQTLLSLAEAWLGRKWPEKKIIKDDFCCCSEGMECPNCQGLTRNKIIDACRIASVVSEKEIKKIVNSYIIPMYKDAEEILKQDLSESAGIQVNNISHAIAEHLKKGEDR